MVVNNNAAAVMLILSTLAQGGEVIPSRGELVEIGGSFRVPDIMELCGCHLREVGTTNKTHLSDYERAIGEQTRALLKVHTSNYRIVGFTESLPLSDIVARCLSAVESWGVYAMLYTGLYFAQTNLYMTGAALKPYDVWLAAYRKEKPEPGWPFGMWQYTSEGTVPGVSTGVDLSVAYKDYAGIIQRAGLGQVRG